MKEDTRESGRTTNYFRYALAAFTALLVLSLGFALIPRPSAEPAAPPFSEQARASALAETLRLRSVGQQLAKDSSGAERLMYSRTVTLLTTQARALLLPSDAAESAAPSPSPTESARSESAGSETAAPATAGGPPTASPPPSASSLAAGLSASGKLRLAHAHTADGGMARLLAAVGTAQLVQAIALAGASGTPVPDLPPAPAPMRTLAAGCQPSGTAAMPSGEGAPPAEGAPPGNGTPASVPAEAAGTAPPVAAEPNESAGAASATAALGRVVRTEVETVYGYQVALTRLDDQAASQRARDLLATHEALVDEAETHTRVHCAPVPPREPGYALDASFLKNPAAGLASLEAGTLPVYGDLVALSDGPTRHWAIASLLGAAQRAVGWGSDPGPVPGLVLDTSQLPPLPETAAPTASRVSPPS